uniref:Uncharacterized protein n=1 Tax=Micrurus surinamensis TaxID=129470 RepID=A0A2D4PXX1_MICSU
MFIFYFFPPGQSVEKKSFCEGYACALLSFTSDLKCMELDFFPSHRMGMTTRIQRQCKRAIRAKAKQEREEKKKKEVYSPYREGNGQKSEVAQHFCLTVRKGNEVVIQETKANLRGLKVGSF